jgi:L-malate glycosyltransferase
MNPPRVVHLVYDLIRGGTEGQCARVAMGLAKRGLPHRVAVFHRRGFFLPQVEAACGPVYELAIRRMLRPSTALEILKFANWLRREKIDVLHAWDADAAIFGQFAASWAGIALVTSRRDLGQIYPPHKTWLMRRADRIAIRVVANARAIRDHFVAQGTPAGKIEVIPNLIDLEEFDAQAKQPFSQEDRLPGGRRTVVVNRLDPEKNTGALIDSLPLLRRHVPDAVLVVAGDGPEMPMLREKVIALGVEDAVCFLGEVLGIPALLRCCDVGALVPVRNEGLSNTLLEYMAAGLPVLATDCGGNRELVREGKMGILLPMGTTQEVLVEMWLGLLSDISTAMEMGNVGRSLVEIQHEPTRVIESFQRIYPEPK